MLTLLAAADGTDPSRSALAQSLAAQDCAAWRLVVVGPDIGPQPEHGDLNTGRIEQTTPDRAAAIWRDAQLAACIDLDDQLHPRAVGAFVAAMAARPDALAVYADCSTVSDGSRRWVLRPAWSPELLRSTRYVGDPFVVRPGVTGLGAAPDLSESSRHDLALRVAEQAEQAGPVLHIPTVLVDHPPRAAASADVALSEAAATTAALTAVRDHIARSKRPFRAEPGPTPASLQLVADFEDPPAVSIIIPTAAAIDPVSGRSHIERCLASLATTQWTEIEVICVVGDECRRDLAALVAASAQPARLVRRPAGAFNFATAINCGALAARHELLVLLNDDTEATDPGWLALMAAHAVDPGVAAVGARLLFGGRRIQHVGMVIDDAQPIHPFVGRTVAETIELGWGVARNVAAVTGACLMTRRREFLRFGGLSSLFPLAYNDVDLCLRMARAGLRIVIEPGATLLHRESSSRNPDVAAWEWQRFLNRWGCVTDPWYHPGFVRPDDPEDRRRNADHELGLRPPEHLEPRGTEIEPRHHAGRFEFRFEPPRPHRLRRVIRSPLRPIRRRRRTRARTGTLANVTAMSGTADEGEREGEREGKSARTNQSEPEPRDQAEPSFSDLHEDPVAAEDFDPIDSDDPNVLRHEILRQRDELGGADAARGLLDDRIAELEARLIRLADNPILRLTGATSRFSRRGISRLRISGRRIFGRRKSGG